MYQTNSLSWFVGPVLELCRRPCRTLLCTMHLDVGLRRECFLGVGLGFAGACWATPKLTSKDARFKRRPPRPVLVVRASAQSASRLSACPLRAAIAPLHFASGTRLAPPDPHGFRAQSQPASRGCSSCAARRMCRQIKRRVDDVAAVLKGDSPAVLHAVRAARTLPPRATRVHARIRRDGIASSFFLLSAGACRE